MGLRDRVKGGLRHVWSPITVWMADQGSDELVHAGRPAKVVVDVRGEDDGTAERVELTLKLLYAGSTEQRVWQLAVFPPTLGTHELQVDLPADLPPSCAGFAEYSYNATLHRSKGTESSAGMVVDVVGDPEHLYWPDGPRAGRDREGEATVEIALDHDVVAAGAPLAGRVTIVPARDLGASDVDLTFGATLTARATPDGKLKRTAKLRLAHPPLAAGVPVEVPFTVQVPLGVPPTLHDGADASVVWQVRVQVAGVTSWRLVGILDPTGEAGVRNRASPSLYRFLEDLTT
jgi:hypothetical protein